MTREVRIEHPENFPGLAILRLDAPDRKNALTGDSAREIRAAFAELEADLDIAALVITGGASFCAGAHRSLLEAAGREEPGALTDMRDVYGVFSDMRALHVPIIAAVCGPAVGAGFNIALAADVRVVADDAYFRSMFIANQIHPGGAHLRMLRDLGGIEIATYLAVLDNPMSGSEFAQRGLASRAVPAESVEHEALRLAGRAAAQPGLARLIKESISATAAMDVEDAADYEASKQAETLAARERP
ncbi:enoyl-CoA hydratase/isomerase family protein [Leucobacter sp. Z1108]|uniref:enoyl-CoA hydratase/isomerase family protein n=1 Tax=Leucobacter sp. Z1108 TaxID=3439066 RepID=UPI003F40AB8A